MSRLSFLDGFRAIAITAVAGFHFFVRWSPPFAETSAYPYGSCLADVPVFRLGFFGIDLFFLISGFVIPLTLQNCEGWYDFAVKRFARLWPALVCCTVLIYLLQLSRYGMPVSAPKPIDLLPSLTTIEPKLLAAVGIRADYVIGAVWTLFIELRFYALAALSFFVLSRRYFLLNLHAYAILGMTLALGRGSLTGGVGMILTSVALVRSIGWFALGAYCFSLHQGTARPAETSLAAVTWALMVGMCWVFPPPLSADVFAPPIASAVLTVAIPALFAATVAIPALRAPFDRPWLVKLGVVSYSLYLLHETLGVAAISRISPGLPLPIQLVLVAATYAGLIVLAALTFAFVEAPGRELIRRWLLGDLRQTHEREAFQAP